MNTLLNIPGFKSASELAETIRERFGPTSIRLRGITEKDFKDPKSDFVITVYLEYLHLLKIESNPSDEQMIKFEYPDAYADTLPLFNIFVVLKKIFAKHQVDDFCLTDLTSPTAKRTHAGIAMMENFTAFCEMALDELGPKVAEVQTSLDYYAELNEKKDKLVAEANKRAKSRVHRAKNVAEMEEQIAARKSSVDKLTPVLDKLTARKTTLEEELLKKKMETSELKETHDQLAQMCEDLDQLVVADPEQIEKEGRERKAALDKMSRQIAESKKALDDSQSEVHVFEQMMEIQSRLPGLVDTASQLKKKLEMKTATVHGKAERLERHEMESKMLRDEYAKKNAALGRLKEKLASEKVKTESRQASMRNNVAQLEKEVASKEAQAETDREECSKLEEKVAAQKQRADHWTDVAVRCEALALERKNAMDDKCHNFVKKTDQEMDAMLEQAERLTAQAEEEAAKSELL